MSTIREQIVAAAVTALATGAPPGVPAPVRTRTGGLCENGKNSSASERHAHPDAGAFDPFFALLSDFANKAEGFLKQVAKNPARWQVWLETHYATCTHPAVVGISEHILAVCRKKSLRTADPGTSLLGRCERRPLHPRKGRCQR